MSKQVNIPDPQSIPLPDEDVHVSSEKRENELMAKMMGFTNFDSTKGKQVEGNNVGNVRVAKKRKYRQYMNRQGGFNRPLDKEA